MEAFILPNLFIALGVSIYVPYRVFKYLRKQSKKPALKLIKGGKNVVEGNKINV